MSSTVWLTSLFLHVKPVYRDRFLMNVATEPIRLVAQKEPGDVLQLSLSIRAGSAHDNPGRHGTAALAATLMAHQLPLDVQIDLKSYGLLRQQR